MKLSEIESKIIECLKNVQPKDLSINEIAKHIGKNRVVVSKYVAVLSARDVVVLSRTVGRAKMFQLAPDYLEKITPKLKVQFKEDFLQYKKGVIVYLSEEVAREYINSGLACEVAE